MKPHWSCALATAIGSTCAMWGTSTVLPCLPRRRCVGRAGKDCARILRAGAISPMERSGGRRAGRADRVGNVPPWIKAGFRAPWKRKRTGRLAVRPGCRMRRATKHKPWRAAFFMAPLIVDRIKRPQVPVSRALQAGARLEPSVRDFGGTSGHRAARHAASTLSKAAHSLPCRPAPDMPPGGPDAA